MRAFPASATTVSPATLRIHAADLLAYAIKTGKDPRAVVERMRKDRDISLWEVLGWVLVGLGLGWLLEELLKGHHDSP